MTTPICKHIQTLAEVLDGEKSVSISKSARPDAVTTANGEIGRKDLYSITKSAQSPPVRMGRGVDPHKVVEQDWEEYHRFMNSRGF